MIRSPISSEERLKNRVEVLENVVAELRRDVKFLAGCVQGLKARRVSPASVLEMGYRA